MDLRVHRPDENSDDIQRDVEITGWRIHLYYASRNPTALFFTALLIIAVGAWLGWQWGPKTLEETAQTIGGTMERKMKQHLQFTAPVVKEVKLDSVLAKRPAPLEEVLDAVKYEWDQGSDVREVDIKLAAAHMVPVERDIARSYWASLQSDDFKPSADLLFFAYQANPIKHSNRLVAELYSDRKKTFDKALFHYERESSLHGISDGVRKEIISLLELRDAHDELDKRATDPAYAQYISTRVRLEAAMRKHDWQGVWPPLLELQKENYSDRTPVVLTCIAGFFWLVLAWQIVQVNGVFSFRLFAPLLAIPLGAASTLPVLFLDLYQRETMGLQQTGDFFNDIVFFVAGVGVREELAKLVFFLPFLPVLLLRKNRLEALIVGACVGLGFAVEENVSYFRATVPAVAFVRFLSANFLHFAATGLVALALFDTLRSPGKNWWRFPAVFAAVALAHGVYDVFYSFPNKWLNCIAGSCFVLLAIAFFRTAAGERGAATDHLFPAATATVGLSVITAAILVCASLEYGLAVAAGMLIVMGIMSLFFMYVLFVLLRDGLREEAPEEKPNYEYN